MPLTGRHISTACNHASRFPQLVFSCRFVSRLACYTLSMDEMDKANAIENEIKESNAFRVYHRLIYLTDVFHIFERNYSEFQKLLTAYKTPLAILPFMSDDKREEFRFINNELSRFFHNYITSAQTLAEITRIMIREVYKDSDFLNEYQARVDNSFKNNPISVFMKELRNYTLHCALPATFSQFQISQDPETKQQITTSHALLHKESLLHGYKWEPLAKHYLAEAPNEIDLLDLINMHHSIFVSFYDWLINRIKDIHNTELDWLLNKQEELRKIIYPIFEQS
jgi:hypothetical protein